MMNGPEKSDSTIVATKLANKAQSSAVQGRRRASAFERTARDPGCEVSTRPRPEANIATKRLASRNFGYSGRLPAPVDNRWLFLPWPIHPHGHVDLHCFSLVSDSGSCNFVCCNHRAWT